MAARPFVPGTVLLTLVVCVHGAAALTTRRGVTAQDDEEAGRVSIGEFYDRASPVDGPWPGVRRGSFTLLIKGVNWTFLNNRWNDLYSDRKKKGDEFRTILQEGLGYDFSAFDQFCRSNKRDFFKVVVFGEGYLVISPESQVNKFAVPVPAALARRLEEFLKPDAPPKDD